MSTGKELRAQGWGDVTAADTAPHRMYGDLVRDALDKLIAAKIPFTAEDVRTAISEAHPEAVAHSPNLLPAVIGGYASAGRIEAVGITHATRRSRRASRNLVWQGAAA